MLPCSCEELLGVMQERSVLLRRWYDVIMDHKEELAKLITLEMVRCTFEHLYDFCLFVVDHSSFVASTISLYVVRVFLFFPASTFPIVCQLIFSILSNMI